ncbi:hypothetical protein [Coxiella burnetii]|uniref:Uncharacterized protein n=1 Tax=Coxiella burnetii (strain RSA 493 / Nine Mile phase I) TaxID=227377 RepID=Q83AH8_COXBU|nr:hypothetical protein [Coxiella burnetii]NP_820885.1 hypothetical protein CBU_1908 [Coxiella burnetii RSA 493]AAO91399.1 hypothetical protein CBU_1908 [Coxiella burnetii RSA 493]ACJ17477.1 hypothetical protein CbuG_0018 [Coxiella burnetii CbuG_Q212]AML48206.1 hypothetical protein AUR58_02675 [Coxiella burnetii]AML54222.1 hypothetical protein AYM38_02310 [Coxiella burnetii]ARI66658.1 hypothetical protein B7L74_09840 [Coxiella burnetii]
MTAHSNTVFEEVLYHLNPLNFAHFRTVPFLRK